jgi:hypothetical protein
LYGTLRPRGKVPGLMLASGHLAVLLDGALADPDLLPDEPAVRPG